MTDQHHYGPGTVVLAPISAPDDACLLKTAITLAALCATAMIGGRPGRNRSAQNLPSQFGFPIVLDPQYPETVFVVVEDEARQNVGHQFTIYRTRDGGESWEPLTQGLPVGAQVKLGVLWHGVCTDCLDPCGVYVGTNTGQLFASGNGGDTWELLADFLPPIYSVTAAVLS